MLMSVLSSAGFASTMSFVVSRFPRTLFPLGELKVLALSSTLGAFDVLAACKKRKKNMIGLWVLT